MPPQTSQPEVIRLGGQYKPEIRIEVRDGRRVVVKDYGACGRWFRWVIGRWLAAREAAAFQAADGVPGIPRFAGRLTPYALAYEFHPGRQCAELEPHELPRTLWRDLETTVQGLHHRGIAHGDLKTLENIMIGDDGTVFLIDFTAAVLRRVSPVHWVVYPHIRQDDLRGIVKAKLILAPDDVTEDERAFLDERSLPERIFRRARRPFRAAAKKLGGPSRSEAEPPALGQAQASAGRGGPAERLVTR